MNTGHIPCFLCGRVFEHIRNKSDVIISGHITQLTFSIPFEPRSREVRDSECVHLIGQIAVSNLARSGEEGDRGSQLNLCVFVHVSRPEIMTSDLFRICSKTRLHSKQGMCPVFM
jgi:hypothetical protein